MRMKYIILILLLCLCIYSCKKNSSTGPDENTTSNGGITGRWQWVETSGGFTPVIIRPSANELIVCQFTSDSNYYSFSHDTLKRLTKYSIRWEQVSINDSATTIRWEDIPTYRQILRKCTKDSLVLCDTGFDGYTSIHIRL